jgi:DNA polymerase III subunit beta
MKVKCNTKDLSNALGIVSRALPVKATMPILEGIKLSATNNVLTLSATDTDIYITRKVAVESLEDGEVVVLGKFFTEFIKKLEDIQEITLEETSNGLKVCYGTNEMGLNTFDINVFPDFRDAEEKQFFSVIQRDLKAVCEKTVFCAATDETRPILKGCLLHLDGSTLTLVALDGYRLAICSCGVALGAGTTQIIIPAKNLTEISKIFADTDDLVAVSVQENLVKFSFKDTIISTRLLAGEFISYQKIIPSTFSAIVNIDKRALESGLDRALLISRTRKNNYIKLGVEATETKISTEIDTMSIKEVVSCTLDGTPLTIAFNAKYLLDAFSRISSDTLNMSFSSVTGPAIISSSSGDLCKYIILPIRLVL